MLEASSETAADIMSRDVAVVHPDTPMRSLLRLMVGRRISGVPVVDEAGRIVGMVSEGDVIRWHDGFEVKQEHWLDQLGEGQEVPAEFVGWIQAQHESVRAIMHPGEAVTVAEDTPVREIEALMTARHIKRVPVLREGRIVGIVSRSDLMRLLARLLEARAGAAPVPPVAAPA
jgi:CBS domain-containing protein